MALSHCGVQKRLTDVDTENGIEATNLRLWYEPVRDFLLSDRPWAFTERQATLTDLGSPPDEWGYRYMFPNNMMRLNYIVNAAQRIPTNKDSEIPFKLIDLADTNGGGILTDLEDAIGVFNFKQTDVTRYTPAFIEPMALLWALRISVPLRANKDIISGLNTAWSSWYVNAIADNQSHRKDDPNADSELVSGR